MRSLALATTLLSGLSLAACGDNGDHPADAAAQADAAKAIDATVDGPAMATSIPLPGGANDVVWDAAHATLYFTNDSGANGTVEKWTAAGGVETVGMFPAVTGPNPSGMIELTDGTLLTVEFGAGANGRLEEMSPAGTGTAYTGLDATIKWLDLEQAPGGTFYAAGFKGNSAAPTGRIFTLVIDRTAHTVVPTELLGPETTGMEQLKKIVGMVVTADALYLSDRTNNQILKYTLPGLVQSTVTTAALPSADFLYALPNGDLITGGASGKLTRIKITDGSQTNVDLHGAALTTIHGLAFDQAGKRLFAIDHPASGADTLNIIPFGGMM